jgi:flagellar hook assembly protein FlgD
MVTLDIYNASGQKVITLAERSAEPGTYAVSWHGIDSAGNPVSSGLYIARLTAKEICLTRKLMVLR